MPQIVPTITLNNGQKCPMLGLGTWLVSQLLETSGTVRRMYGKIINSLFGFLMVQVFSVYI